MKAVAPISALENGLTFEVEVRRPPPVAMTSALNVNRIFAPDTAVVHRDEAKKMLHFRREDRFFLVGRKSLRPS